MTKQHSTQCPTCHKHYTGKHTCGGTQSLTWSHTKPTTTGWYWMRNNVGCMDPANPVHIAPGRTGELCFYARSGGFYYVAALNDTYEWAGPIPTPKEA